MESWGGGLEEALILLYLLVDDGYRAVTFGGRLRQRGPELSDVEVLTMEIFGEQQGRFCQVLRQSTRYSSASTSMRH